MTVIRQPDGCLGYAEAVMELDEIEAFVAIVKHGGFTRASSVLHLSQPAISRRVHLLEQEVGAPLFDRVHRGVAINDAGRAFLPHAEALLASMRDAIEAVGAVRGTNRGVVSLAVVGTLASSSLTERLRHFRHAHPAVDLRLRTALSAEVSALVLCGDAVLGLRYETDPNPYLISTTIHNEPLVPVCSSSHRFARARRIDPQRLSAERWLGFPRRPGIWHEPYVSALERRLAAWGLTHPEILPVDSLTAQKRLVEAGFGVALLPESSVDEELRAGSLRVMRVTGIPAAIPIVLIRRRHGFQSGAAQSLAGILGAWSKSPRGRF